MRWDKLFADLEAGADNERLVERDALVAELSQGEWSETSWCEVLGGEVSIRIRGFGVVSGELVFANRKVLHVRDDRSDYFIVPAAVLTASGSVLKSVQISSVGTRIGWAQLMRNCQRSHEHVVVHDLEGSPCAGRVVMVGEDFIRVEQPQGLIVVPFSALTVLSCRRVDRP